MSAQRNDKLCGIFDNRAKMRREYWFDGEIFEMRGHDTLNIWPTPQRAPWGRYPDLPPDGPPPPACSNCGHVHALICSISGASPFGHALCDDWAPKVEV